MVLQFKHNCTKTAKNNFFSLQITAGLRAFTKKIKRVFKARCYSSPFMKKISADKLCK
jgi:hypothetical protein